MYTSENLAGFWPRLMAHNMDLLVLLPAYYGLSILLTSDLTLLLTCLVMTYLYEVLFTTFWQGTPGKKMMKMRIVLMDGSSLSWAQASLRSLTKVVTVGTLFIGYLVIIFHPLKKGLHDMAVNSVVIFKNGI